MADGCGLVHKVKLREFLFVLSLAGTAKVVLLAHLYIYLMFSSALLV